MGDMLLTETPFFGVPRSRLKMQILTPEDGDKTLDWDKNDPAQIEDAQASFDFWTKEKGFRAFSVDKAGKRTEVTKFDPALERILVAPMKALIGG